LLAGSTYFSENLPTTERVHGYPDSSPIRFGEVSKWFGELSKWFGELSKWFGEGSKWFGEVSKWFGEKGGVQE